MRFYSCYAFDLDGTLYRGQEVVPGAPETLAYLEKRGADILFVTNNSGMTRSQYVAKLEKLGFRATPDQVITSGRQAASVCASEGLRRIFVVGEPGLVATLREFDITVVNADEEGNVTPTDIEADAVVSGICREALSYQLLDAAMQVAIKSGRYIACNGDLTYPVEGGRFCPGSGAIVAAIEACSGISARVVGKPKPDMLSAAIHRLRHLPTETLMVGDRMDTDIECGRAAGCDTALVLSGVTQRPVENQWCIHSVTELASQL